MKINLQEDAENQYISFYQGYLEKVQLLNKKVNDVLNEVMRQSKYDELQRLISGIIDAYAEVILNNIESGVFPTWQESEGSLRACLRTYRAGDAADEVCMQIEQKMGDLTRDILKIEKADVIITERPVVSEDGLEQIEDICRTAQAEMNDIKEEYISQALDKEEDNDIYGTLRPLIEGVAANMEAFFEASLIKFVELHERVKENSAKLHDIAQENLSQFHDNAKENGIHGGSVSKKVKGDLTKIASSMGKADNAGSLSEFKEVTKLLYKTIGNDEGSKRKKLPYKLIAQIMPIYHKFYSDFGSILKDRFASQDEREEFIKREYLTVTTERDNDKFFDGEEAWTFKSYACRTYTVFDRVADMEKNIAECCINGTANAQNLLYGAYVLFDPIINGYIAKEDSGEYKKFSKWASKEILRILGADKNNDSSDNKDAEIDFSGENFSDENIRLFVKVVEKIVGEVGVKELNEDVEKNYDSLTASRSIYSKKVSIGTVREKHRAVANTYGRYIVTDKSIQRMAPVCMQANSILEPLDKFYKEKFENLESNYEKANKVVHAMSTFIGLFSLGSWDLSKLFSTEEAADDASAANGILDKIQLGGLALATSSTAGKIINGGAFFIKALDWAMPYFKKSRILVKLNEKVWNLTRQDISIPYVHRMMDQYMMEHYEIKYGMTKSQSGMFEFCHDVTTKIEDRHQRRTFENAMFAADMLLTPPYYVLAETDLQKRWAIYYGVYLNLVRSGMCIERDIESEAANGIVDKLYNIYREKRSVIPRVDIDPGKRIIG